MGCNQSVIPFGRDLVNQKAACLWFSRKKTVGLRVGRFWHVISKEVMGRKALEDRAAAMAIWSTMAVGALREMKREENDTASKLAPTSLTPG